jgi:hypothetical protein
MFFTQGNAIYAEIPGNLAMEKSLFIEQTDTDQNLLIQNAIAQRPILGSVYS